MHIALYRIFHGKYLLPNNFTELEPRICLLIVQQFSQKLVQSLALNINRFLKRVAKQTPEKYPPKLFTRCQVICQVYKNTEAEAHCKNLTKQPYYIEKTTSK